MLVWKAPTEISGSVFSALRCMGRVIYEQKAKEGNLAYGVKIEAIAPRDLLRSTEGKTEGRIRGALRAENSQPRSKG